MRIQTQLFLAVFLTGALGIAGLVADRSFAAYELLYGRAQEHSEALLATAEAISLPYLRGSGDIKALKRAVAVLGRLPRVLHIKLYDRDGTPVLDTGGPRVPGQTAPGAEKPPPRFIEVQKTLVDPLSGAPLGSLRLARSTEGIHESLLMLVWRGVALGSLALITLAAMAWTIGLRFGRRLESLALSMESIEVDKRMDIPEGGTDSEIDRLSRSFKALHARLALESSGRKKLESLKDDLTNMLIHDLKQPLTVLNAVFSILDENGGEDLAPGRRHGLLKMAQKNLHYESAMIEDLLQLARLTAAEMPLVKRRLPLRRFVEECGGENAVVAEQSHRRWSMEIGDAAGSIWMFGDTALLKRLVGNLVLNAVEHSPPGSLITLGARLREKDLSRAEIFVRNEGPGIPTERREAIFRKYATFAESTRNVGLGLAFCRLVAEKHSARLTLLDTREPGTTFALSIPVSSEPPLEADPIPVGTNGSPPITREWGDEEEGT